LKSGIPVHNSLNNPERRSTMNTRVRSALFFNPCLVLPLAVLLTCLVLSAAPQTAQPDKQAKIREALSAAPPDVAKTAKVMDWDGTVLKEGTGAYTCYPTPPQFRKVGKEPMCMDHTWMAWADAWQNKKPFKADQVGIAYMLTGDTGASNTDPYADAPTSNNQWVVSGPHIMLLAPDLAQLEGLSTDPNNGGPFVMWKGTPYAHIMVPVGKHPAKAATPQAKHK
jgi:hypothetical protein